MDPDPHYSILIEWSLEDRAFVVILSEWAYRYKMPVAEGATYEDALARGRNALEDYVQFAHADGVPLPQPRQFVPVCSSSRASLRSAGKPIAIPPPSRYTRAKERSIHRGRGQCEWQRMA